MPHRDTPSRFARVGRRTRRLRRPRSGRRRRGNQGSHRLAVVAIPSRNVVFLNFPTEVRGISAANSMASGSHHFANCGARNRQISSAGRALPRLQHDHRQRPLVPLRMRHRDHRGFRHARMAHQRGFERHRADPLPARLHQILRAIGQLDAAVSDRSSRCRRSGTSHRR